MRFLSHAETLRLFQRACVRAGIHVRYSEGFNPRPKLSLPLPRPVGVESDDELLCLHVIEMADKARIHSELAAQLPEYCDVLSVDIAKPGVSFQPHSATYILPITPNYPNERLQTTIERLMASDNLQVRRRMDAKGIRIKTVDVRVFLKSITLDNRDIMVDCRISPSGSIRLDEILELLELDKRRLSGPIRRTNVQWQRN